MEFYTKKVIKDLEGHIENSYSLKIFKGYAAVDKRGVEKFIDTIYASLPVDIINARKFLQNRNYNFGQPSENNENSQKKSGIYNYLKELEIKMDNAFQFATYAVVSVKDIEKIIDKIYDNIPEEIIKAEVLSKE